MSEPDHHPRCYQNTGVPDDLPANLCDCRVLRMLDGRVGAECDHQWIDRPESDTVCCDLCGIER